jgi:hypothetical protein
VKFDEVANLCASPSTIEYYWFAFHVMGRAFVDVTRVGIATCKAVTAMTGALMTVAETRPATGMALFLGQECAGVYISAPALAVHVYVWRVAESRLPFFVCLFGSDSTGLARREGMVRGTICHDGIGLGRQCGAATMATLGEIRGTGLSQGMTTGIREVLRTRSLHCSNREENWLATVRLCGSQLCERGCPSLAGGTDRCSQEDARQTAASWPSAVTSATMPTTS